MGNCRLEINGKIFQTEETLHDDLMFELPELNIPSNSDYENSSTVKLKTLNSESVQHIVNVVKNLKPPLLEVPNHGHHQWTNTTSIIIILIIIVCLIVFYIKFVRPKLIMLIRRKKENVENSQNKDPSFFQLRCTLNICIYCKH
ncbi:hypothetical protein PPYR_06224 [Photinus pyralis]|uniref:Uncharacterized protein n=1 Tax=Photinus pyralis TaxID=7054 RepID=A0A5N4AT09_PHOPY|nr:hypothetical protein PPYR_06224 [Photinus pyralis]